MQAASDTSASGSTESNARRDAALAYAAQGCKVVLLHGLTRDATETLICTCGAGERCGSPGKHPRTSNGVKDATDDPSQIRAWFDRWPNSNIGIATGSASGLDGLDLDARKGGVESFQSLLNELGIELADTPTARTSRGGFHIYFKAAGIACGRDTPATGIDPRGENGFLVAPPSHHATGERYQWESGLEIGGVAPVEIPPTLLARLKRASKPGPEALAAPTWCPPANDGISEWEIWKRLAAPRAKPEHLAAVTRMRQGVELFPRGSHHYEIWSLVSYLRWSLPEVSDATLIRILERSVRAMNCADHDLEHVAGELAKAGIQYGQQIAENESVRGALVSTVGAEELPDGSAPFEAPPGYTFRAERSGKFGLFRVTGTGEQLIAAAPIEVCGVGDDESGHVYLTLRWIRGDREQRVTLPRATVASASLTKLAALGAPVSQANCARVQEYLQVQEQFALDRLPKQKVFTCSGWSSNFRSFVSGATVIGEPGLVLLQGDGDAADALVPKGDATEHLRLMLAVRDRGPIAEMFWAGAFAAPLLALVEMRSFCLCVHGASGSGKSAVQAVAASAFGRPSSQKLSGDISQAALQGELARHRDHPTWLDDTQITRNELLELLTYLVSTEISGARATQSGELRRRTTWRTLVMVSGEKALLQVGGAAGAKNRTLEVRGQPIGDPALAQATHRGLEHHHGHTGPAFIRGLLDRYILPGERHRLGDRLRKYAAALSGDASELVRYAALLVLADVLAREIICGEHESTAEPAALSAGRVLLENARHEVAESLTTVEAAYDQITGWVASHYAEFQPGTLRERAGDIIRNCKEAGGRTVAVILPPAMSEIAKLGGFNVRQVFRELLDRGLAVGDGTHQQKKHSFEGGQRSRAYWIVLDTATPPSSPVPPPQQKESAP